MKYRVLLIGGGTAGHIEPALAVGKWLREQNNSPAAIECEFLGTTSGLERELVPNAGFKLHTITKAPLPRKLNATALFWPVKLLLSVFQSLLLIKRFDLIIGFGGYVSAPAYIAGWILRVPIVIHEANAKPGWANNLGARFSKKNTVAFASAQSTGRNWRDADVVGMPMRAEIRAVALMPQGEVALLKSKICTQLNLDAQAPIVFAFGGSLGSRAMNTAITGSINEFTKLGLNFIHVVGKANLLPKATKGYAPLAYVSNMAELYAISDLVIARSGAVTCAELMTTGKFALLVPLPIGNGEQVANAATLVQSEQAEICENTKFNSDWLSSNISRLLALAKSRSAKGNTFTNQLDAQAQLGVIALSLLVGSKK